MLVRRTYDRALVRYGPVDGELLAVALLEDEAGHKLRPGMSTAKLLSHGHGHWEQLRNQSSARPMPDFSVGADLVCSGEHG